MADFVTRGFNPGKSVYQYQSAVGTYGIVSTPGCRASIGLEFITMSLCLLRNRDSARIFLYWIVKQKT